MLVLFFSPLHSFTSFCKFPKLYSLIHLLCVLAHFLRACFSPSLTCSSALSLFPTLIIPPSQQSSLFPSIPILHFHHSSLRELIASSFVLGEQRGTMAEWGLSLWQQAGDKRKEGGRETKKKGRERKSRHRGDAGC